jgi:heme-degrading monooxygenase HmoA
MHVQVVTFRLNGVTEEQYHEACRDLADTFANLPGLLAKIWLRGPETGTYGGVYLWRDRDAFEDYIKGEVFKAVENDPVLTDVRSVDFGVFSDLTQITQPEVVLV